MWRVCRWFIFPEDGNVRNLGEKGILKRVAYASGPGHRLINHWIRNIERFQVMGDSRF